MTKTRLLSAGMLVALTCASTTRAAPRDYFAIRVVDDQTGRGIPLTYLKTTYHTTYMTDNNGYVAFLEPGLMEGRDVWFEVKSYGYEEPAGAFGVRGVALKPAAGKSAEVRLKRTNVAERLYRMTGYGTYRDTVLLGKQPPIKNGLLNAQVTGQDTVQTAIYRNRMYWMWQDTERVSFGLGGFSMTGATSALPSKLNLDKGIDFDYFVEKPGEFARSMAVVKREGNNPIWVDGLTVVKDEKGRERMLGKYVAANKDFSVAESGLLLYNDQKEIFEVLKKFDGNGKGTLSPGGHPVRVRDGDTAYIYYSSSVRVKADFESASDPAKYEGFTCLNQGGQPERANGKLVWSWRTGAQPVTFKKAEELVKSKAIRPEESPYQVVDVESGKPVNVHGGSIAWNRFIKRWTLVFGEVGGTSNLGEIWISTANSPEGPWGGCRKVATHAMANNNNDLYNVVQHDELQGKLQGDGKFIYFEGTFVHTFSGNPAPTPYYNYNNIMYRLDMTDPRLKLPEPPPGLTKATADQTNEQERRELP